AGHLHVDPVFGGAGDLTGPVNARDVLADVAKARRGLEALVLDPGQLSWNLGEASDGAITDPAVRGLVHNNARLGRKLADRHPPFLRHRVEQHSPRLRAG